MQNSNIEKTMASYELDKLDEKILKLIIGDARKPFLEVLRGYVMFPELQFINGCRN